MNYNITENLQIDFGNMDNSFFLIGLLNEFMNQFQVIGDKMFEEISWKQGFLLVCTGFFKQPPTLKDLSDMIGCSHQNTKQMLLKLEKQGFVKFIPDEEDRRKQRIVLTEKAEQFSRQNEEKSNEAMAQLFTDIDAKDLDITVKTIMKLDEQLKKMK